MSQSPRMTYNEIAAYFDAMPITKADIRSSLSDMKGVKIATDQLGEDGTLFEMADLLNWVAAVRRK